MKSFTQRRTFSICVTVLTAIIVLAVYTIGSGTLRQHGFLSGWILLALIVFLALYNVRKALPFLPLGSSASWLQFHI
jgi:ATP/ADP translocase